MLQDLSEISTRYGLKINYDKTKVLTWNALAGGQQSVSIGDKSIGVLDEKASERYLGRQLSFHNSHAIKLKNRIAAGWAAFHKNKAELHSQ